MNLDDQRRAMTKLRSLIEAGERAINNLDPNLRVEVLQERTAKIRAEYAEKTDEVLFEMAKRRTDAQAALPRWTQEAIRRRAKFSEDVGQDAMIRLAHLEVLKRTPTAGLLDHLDDAVEAKSLALAELVRLEWESRTDRTADLSANLPNKFETKFSSLADPVARDRHAELEEIVALPETAIVLMREFQTGKSDPIGRMTAARISSLGTPPRQTDDADRAADLRASAA